MPQLRFLSTRLRQRGDEDDTGLGSRRFGPERKPAKFAHLQFTYAVPRCSEQSLGIPHKLKARSAVEGGEISQKMLGMRTGFLRWHRWPVRLLPKEARFRLKRFSRVRSMRPFISGAI